MRARRNRTLGILGVDIELSTRTHRLIEHTDTDQTEQKTAGQGECIFLFLSEEGCRHLSEPWKCGGEAQKARKGWKRTRRPPTR